LRSSNAFSDSWRGRRPLPGDIALVGALGPGRQPELPSHGAKNAPNAARMVANTGYLVDDRTNTVQGPAIAGETIGTRPSAQRLVHWSPVLAVKLGLTP